MTRVQVVPNEIPESFRKLGVTEGFDPKSPDRLRLFITGKPGEGKTTFTMSMPDTLVLDFDDGAENVAGGHAQRVPIRSFAHWMEMYSLLIESAKSGTLPWQRVVFDSADSWHLMEEIQLCKELSSPPNRIVHHIGDYGTKGAGYGRLYRMCFSRLSELYQAGYSWVVVGHLSEKRITVGYGENAKDQVVLRPSMYPGFVKLLAPECDYHMTVYSADVSEQLTKTKMIGGVEKEVPAGTQKVAHFYLRLRGTSDEKRRLPMPRKIELPVTDSWALFCTEYAKAREAAEALDKKEA